MEIFCTFYGMPEGAVNVTQRNPWNGINKDSGFGRCFWSC